MAWWPFTRSRETREEKASAAGAAIAAYFLGRPVWTPRNYASLSEEAFVKNAVAHRCVKLIASSAAAVPWLLSDKGGREIEKHPLLDLLMRPAPMVGGASLFEAFYAYLLIAGNTYLESVGPDGKPPKELWNQRPDRMKAVAGPHGLPRAYQAEINGRTVTWEVDPLTGMGPILHVKEFHPLNDWYGLGRTEPAAYAIDRHNAASAHNKALLDNGARPSGALIFEPIKKDDGTMEAAPTAVITAAEKALAEKSGPAGAGRPFVFGGNVKWEEMGISPRDMDFAAGKEDAARDICVSYGVPHILIVPGQATYNNLATARLELWESTILPLLDKVVDALDAWLTPQFGDGLRLGIDLDAISDLEPRREAKRKSTLELLTAGVIDPDEARDALQYEPRSAEAVKKVDPATLKALIEGAKAGPAQLPPLFRYQKSVGLLPPETTLEQFMADFQAEDLEPDDEEALAAQLTPPETEENAENQ